MAQKKRKRKAKPYDRYDDIQRAELFSVYTDNDGDLDRTYKALKRKVTKTALKALEEDKDWPRIHQYIVNNFMKGVVDQAIDRKKETLAMLHNARVRAYNAIIGDDEKGIAPARAKTQGEAVDSLVSVIEKEGELLGGIQPESSEDATIGLLKMVLNRYFSERKGMEDERQDADARGRALGIIVDVGSRKD